jgi:hypothetical protein
VVVDVVVVVVEVFSGLRRSTPPSNHPRAVRALLLLVLALGAGACVEVKPWQRGDLAHPCMVPEDGARMAAEAGLGHTGDVREGFTPCFSGQAGGGCGCN